jgi:hypothetical protein
LFEQLRPGSSATTDRPAAGVRQPTHVFPLQRVIGKHVEAVNHVVFALRNAVLLAVRSTRTQTFLHSGDRLKGYRFTV